MIRMRIGFLVLICLLLTSCNLFKPFDSPSGDEQYLSKARACFDEGDYDCARDYYSKLEGTSYADIKITETAFTVLDEQGADIGAVLGGATGGKYGVIFTTIANRMLAKGLDPSVEKRIKIYESLRTAKNIQNIKLQGLVRFMTAAGLAAEIFAEDAVSLGQSELTRELVADNPSTCESNNSACPVAGDVNCAKTGSILIPAAAIDLWATVAPVLTGTANMAMVKAAMDQVNLGIADIGVGGSLGSSASSFGTALAAVPVTTAAGVQCFRLTMLQQGVGQ